MVFFGKDYKVFFVFWLGSLGYVFIFELIVIIGE